MMARGVSVLQELRIKNFKSWKDSGSLRLAPLTGIFGVNSSGKSSLLQALLALKMTAESSDRRRILETGDYSSLIEIGSLPEILYGRDPNNTLGLSLSWTLDKPLAISDPGTEGTLFSVNALNFETSIELAKNVAAVETFSYRFQTGTDARRFGMRKKSSDGKYTLISEGYTATRIHGRAWPLPPPVKCYAFPDEAVGYYQNTGFLPWFPLKLENALKDVAYLGPSREWPRRLYRWSGEAPADLDFNGERAIEALLAAGSAKKIGMGRGKTRKSVTEMVEKWMQDLGLLREFFIRRISENRNTYEVAVRKGEGMPEVLLPDVGFGVSQILPVLALIYYVPEGSTVILEHPEMHLHPAAQAGLADLLIDAVERQKIQVIVESHSEHLLRRLQLRIAEEKLAVVDTALYFCRATQSGSIADQLKLNQYGDITNWPKDFFGDELGEVAARTQAAMKRQGAAD